MQGVYSILINSVVGAVLFPGTMNMQQSRARLTWAPPGTGDLEQRLPDQCVGCRDVCNHALDASCLPGSISGRERSMCHSSLRSSHGICICRVLHCTRQTTSYKTDGWLHKQPFTHHTACHSQSNKPKEMLNHIWVTAVAVYLISRGMQQHLCISQTTLTFADSSCRWITAL